MIAERQTTVKFKEKPRWIKKIPILQCQFQIRLHQKIRWTKLMKHSADQVDEWEVVAAKKLSFITSSQASVQFSST